jgi:hypothetical protein
MWKEDICGVMIYMNYGGRIYMKGGYNYMVHIFAIMISVKGGYLWIDNFCR